MNAPAPQSKSSPKQHFNRARAGGVAVYVVLSVLSVAFGIRAPTAMNALGAEIGVGASNEGSHFVTVANRSHFAWTNARIDIDGRYFIEIGDVPPGDQRAPQLSEFTYAYQVPRAPELFHWESSAEEGFADRLAPSSYAPSNVTLRCDQGMIVEEVAP